MVVTGGETRPAELGDTKEVRHETREQQFRLTGDGYTSGFNPNDPVGEQCQNPLGESDGKKHCMIEWRWHLE